MMTIRRPVLETLEERILYSADPGPAGLVAAVAGVGHQTLDATPGEIQGTELVFVDSRSPDRQQLLDDFAAQQEDGRQLEVVVVDAAEDGIGVISRSLAERSDVSAIHIVGHGEAGSAQLGASRLDGGTLLQRAGEIAAWGDALAPDADLLLYGCDVGATQAGRDLVNSLAQLTGADVAASNDPTGNALLGGNWQLEVHSGRIDTASAVSSVEQTRWQGLLNTYTVTTTADSGAGTLRQAILDANANSGADSIDFAIGGTGVHTITLASVLPTITDTVSIDATTDDSFAANGGRPAVVIDVNARVGSGLTLGATADGSSIRGLVINNYTNAAININSGSDGNTIAGNYLGGLDANGNQISVNGSSYTVFVQGANNIIGGSTDADRNVISSGSSGNYGILIFGASANGNTVSGNYIGTDASGTTAFTTSMTSVSIQSGASNNVIGGPGAGAGNVIASASNLPVYIATSGGGTVVQGNRIGVSSSGSLWSGSSEGIRIDSSTIRILDNWIGGGTTAISLNASSGNVIQGNRIGTDLAGTANWGPSQYGILIQGSNNLVGGTGAGQGNIVANSNQGGGANDGIAVASGSGNALLGNSIFGTRSASGALGIDLAGNGVTANDSLDGDGGANNLQNLPVLTLAKTDSSGQVTVSGSLNSTASSYFRVELFANPGASSTGYGEGRIYLGFVNVATDSSGNATFSTTSSAAIPVGYTLSATATKSNSTYDAFTDTSEFARDVVAIPETQGTVVVDTAADITDGDTTSLSTLLANKGADGKVSLREAITAANNTANGSFADLITFSISASGVQTITLSSVLPSITDAVIINGATEPGYAGSPLISINGGNSIGNMFTLDPGSSGSTLRGLNLQNFTGYGIYINGSSNNTVAGNYLGTNAAGDASAGTSTNPVVISNGNNNLIGGSTASDRNVIAGNYYSGLLSIGTSTGNLIRGNYFGINAGGTAIVGSAIIQIEMASPGNTIGGSGAGQGNVISGRLTDAWDFIDLWEAASNTVIQGNIIGLNAAGTAALTSTGNDGIYIRSSNNLIGGTNAGEGNVIGGVVKYGIHIGNSGSGGSGNTIQGNYIGTDISGSVIIANGLGGIAIDTNANDNLIGGVVAGAGNLIEGNAGDGVLIKSGAGSGNSILGNSISNSSMLGINLQGGSENANGVTANDTGDADSGPNTLQNYPALASAFTSGGNTTIVGTLNSTPSTNYRIEFFSSSTADASNHGEAGLYLGFVTVSTNASGDASFNATLSGVLVPAGHFVTATATVDLGGGQYGSTSEFAANVIAAAQPSIRVSPTSGLVTTEAGGTAQFNVVLGSAPTADVVIALSSSNPREGSLSASVLTFTSANWSTPQTVTVTGVDDTVIDGDVTYSVITAAATSADPAYNGLNAADISLGNTDNDSLNSIVVDTAADLLDGDTTSLAALMANKGADGFISLREAITAANNTANGPGGADHIHFSIAGTGTHTITLASALPAITDAVVIDARTDDSFAANANRPAIVLDGNNLNSDGLEITSGGGGSTIRGLVIHNFQLNGIRIDAGSDSNTIAGNYLGKLTTDGTMGTVGNGQSGLSIRGNGNLIGGDTAADRNVIAGNASRGIFISAASGNQIIGNYLGTDATGNASVNNGEENLWLESGSTGNTVGGSSSSQRNVLAGSRTGIVIDGENSDGNAILGNWIGLGADGSTVLGTGYGIEVIHGADNTVIGGAVAGQGNVIVGATGLAISLNGITSGSVIRGNFLGTDSTLSVLGGNYDNIDLSAGAFNNMIGGTAAGDGNYLTNSGYNGFYLWPDAGSGNAVLGNRIWNSRYAGIDLTGGSEDAYGVTANDTGDTDTGPNDLQNYPVLISAFRSGGDTMITGTLNSSAVTTYRIEFFSAPAADSSGHGGASTFLGFVTVSTNASGDASFNATLSGVLVPAGHFVTATATVDLGGGQYGSTSEFAANVIAAAQPSITVSPTSGLVTTEAGGTAQFTVVLGSAPTADVVIALSSSNPREGSLSASVLTFTSANWSTPQTVTVTGVDDTVIDGDVTYSVITAAATSADPAYNGLNAADISLGNTDNDSLNSIVVDTAADLLDGDTTSLAALMANKGADGFISLREAITAANNTANGPGGADHIHFSIAGTGTHTITLASALPAITDAVVIDARTDDSFAANANRPAIVLDGNNLNADGLEITSGGGGSTVRGLVIQHFGGDGIQIDSGSSGNTIAGNYIGAIGSNGLAGGTGMLNGAGLFVLGANNVIGGTTIVDRNVIGGNANGIVIGGAAASGNQVMGNYVGSDATGNVAVANTFDGVRLQAGATGNIVGGSLSGQRNVISGNGQDGVQVADEASDGNTLRGNWIGVKADGTQILGNGADGVMISGGADNTMVGGSGANDGNWIAGNGIVGVEIDGATTGTLIQGNRIGTDLTGVANWGGQQAGVLIENSSVATGPSGNSVFDNLIAFSGQGGGAYSGGIVIADTAGTGNSLMRNVIYSSGGLGIDLNADNSVQANDAGDADSGPNSLQNYPVLTSVVSNGSIITIGGTLNSLAGTNYRIEFFASPAGDASGHGEASAYLGSVDITTNGVGNATLSTTWAASVPVGYSITATATRANADFSAFSETSEFSADILAQAANTAPTITQGATTGMGGAYPEDSPSAGFPVFGIISIVDWADPDAGAAPGMALIGTTGNGTWQYSTDLTTWHDVGTVSGSSALLLSDTSWLRYVGDGANAESPTIQFRAWDMTSGTASTNVSPSYVTPDAGGGTSAFSAQAASGFTVITGVNDAPLLTPGNPVLSTITEDQTSDGGQTVASILGSSASDVDDGALQGIAVVTTTDGNGSWEFSINGGTSWTAVGAVNDGSALLLRAEDKIRFVPNGQNGTAASISYRAWDQSSGTVGSKTDTGSNGGTTAFSSATDTATLTVSGVNDAPVITSSATASVVENSTAVLTVTATDSDQPAQTLSYAITGGADAAKFQIDANTGALSFITAPDFEAPTDADRDNIYEVRVVVSDGALSAAVSIMVSVTDQNEPPGGGDGKVIVREDETYIFTMSDLGLDATASQTLSVRVTSLPVSGRLTLGGEAVKQGQAISRADIAGGLLAYRSAQDEFGSGYASFGFRLHDDVSGLEGQAHAMQIDVLPVNDAPLLAAGPMQINQGGQTQVPAEVLSVHDVDTQADLIRVVVDQAENGHFAYSVAPGTAISQFGLADLDSGRVVFIHDNPDLRPILRIHVDDGQTSSASLLLSVSYRPVAGPVTVPPPVQVVPPDVVPGPLASVEPPQVPQRVVTPPEVTSGGTAVSKPGTESSEGARRVMGADAALPLPAPAFPADPPNSRHVTTVSTVRLERAQIVLTLGSAPGGPLMEFLLSGDTVGRSSIGSGGERASIVSGHAPPALDDGTYADAQLALQAVKMTGLVLSIGTIWWAVRASGLVASVLMAAPAWISFDPLPVLGPKDEDEPGWGEEADSAPDERNVEEMFEVVDDRGAWS